MQTALKHHKPEHIYIESHHLMDHDFGSYSGLGINDVEKVHDLMEQWLEKAGYDKALVSQTPHRGSMEDDSWIFVDRHADGWYKGDPRVLWLPLMNLVETLQE